MRIRLFLLGMGLMIASITQAQMTGVVVEVDTAFYGPNTPTPEDTFDPSPALVTTSASCWWRLALSTLIGALIHTFYSTALRIFRSTEMLQRTIWLRL